MLLYLCMSSVLAGTIVARYSSMDELVPIAQRKIFPVHQEETFWYPLLSYSVIMSYEKAMRTAIQNNGEYQIVHTGHILSRVHGLV